VNDLTGAPQDNTRQAAAISGSAGRVLVVDDVDGNERLASIERNPPDLILFDVLVSAFVSLVEGELPFGDAREPAAS